MKIFITGASGFIGGAIAREFSKTHEVLAMARSGRSAEKVKANGCEPVTCDLTNISASHLEGCEAVIHCAAFVEPWGSRTDFWEGNVSGTERMLKAAKEAGVKRFIHMGSETALFRGQDLLNINESYPYPDSSPFLYSETKKEAEIRVINANIPGEFETISLRPRLVWGPGDTTILASLVEMVDTGKFAWIGHGAAKTSSTYIGNLVEGTRLAFEKGKGGECYFIADNETHTFKEIISDWLKTQGRTAPNKNLPAGFTKFAAWGLETAWKTLGIKSKPPATRFSAAIMTCDCTLDISKAKNELGYEPPFSYQQGLESLRG